MAAPSADCPCAGATLHKFVQPAVLTVLAQGPLYGYRIAERVARLPIVKDRKLDATGLYRTLKTMERRGLSQGQWSRSEVGPDRRLYLLTRGGEECLRRWVATLREHREAVGDLLVNVRRACARLEPSAAGKPARGRRERACCRGAGGRAGEPE